MKDFIVLVSLISYIFQLTEILVILSLITFQRLMLRNGKENCYISKF